MALNIYFVTIPPSLRWKLLNVHLNNAKFRTKIGKGWARGALKKIGTPYLLLQLLKLGTSNLGHNLGLRSSIPRNDV